MSSHSGGTEALRVTVTLQFQNPSASSISALPEPDKVTLRIGGRRYHPDLSVPETRNRITATSRVAGHRNRTGNVTFVVRGRGATRTLPSSQALLYVPGPGQLATYHRGLFRVRLPKTTG